MMKKNLKLGRVYYEKAPNFLQKMWKRIKDLRLSLPSANKEQNSDTYMGKLIKPEPQPQSQEERIVEALRSGVGDPEFNLEEFAKAYEISPEEVKKYMEDPKIMGKTDKNRLFRLRQRNTKGKTKATSQSPEQKEQPIVIQEGQEEIEK